MNKKEISLEGKICPFPVVHIVREVDMMRGGEILRFTVDDPLAIKSVPEELEDSPGVSVDIRRSGRAWEIIIRKE